MFWSFFLQCLNFFFFMTWGSLFLSVICACFFLIAICFLISSLPLFLFLFCLLLFENFLFILNECFPRIYHVEQSQHCYFKALVRLFHDIHFISHSHFNLCHTLVLLAQFLSIRYLPVLEFWYRGSFQEGSFCFVFLCFLSLPFCNSLCLPAPGPELLVKP